VEGQIKEVEEKQEKKKAEVIMRPIYQVLKLITCAAYTSSERLATTIPKDFCS
jgi:hypothetical protein